MASTKKVGAQQEAELSLVQFWHEDVPVAIMVDDLPEVARETD